jgi:predicted porin
MKYPQRLTSRLTLYSGLAVLAFTPGTAGALDAFTVGDWQVEFSGNVNGFATLVDCKNNSGSVVAGGLACGSFDTRNRDFTDIRTGLLPSWLGFSARTEHNGLSTGVTVGFQPGIDSNTAIAGAPIDGGLGLNSANFRQVFLDFGGDWGTIKIGRDLGIFGSDAILSDMTLLGVGTVSDLTQGGGNTSLGRIGVGYMYADWKGQIQYSSPDWQGFSFSVALVDPWGAVNLSGLSLDAGSFDQKGDTFGFEGALRYAWEGDFSGKVWASFITQKLDSFSFASRTAAGWDLGAKVNIAGFEVVAYWYDGDGIGTTDFLFDALDAGGNKRDSDGGYVQATYAIPGPGTKVGLSFGRSNLDRGPADPADTPLLKSNESWIIGAYHPLTPALNLVFEYTSTESKAHNGAKAEEGVFAIGAILFF